MHPTQSWIQSRVGFDNILIRSTETDKGTSFLKPSGGYAVTCELPIADDDLGGNVRW